jgi:uncharacterized membrane protein YkgB
MTSIHTIIERSGTLRRLDRTISAGMRRFGFLWLRWSVAIIFMWFGALKFFPGLSPASDLVATTVYWMSPSVFIPILAAWEVAIGLCLLYRPLVRVALLLLFLQMGGTFLPLVVLPQVTWQRFPVAPTLEGQYIIKNLIIIGAALVIGSTVRQQSQTDRKL